METKDVTNRQNYIKIDHDLRQMTINLDYPGEVWNVLFNAPETHVSMKFKSLSIETDGDLSLKTPDDKYILLNTTREEYKEWLRKRKNLQKAFEEMKELYYNKKGVCKCQESIDYLT